MTDVRVLTASRDRTDGSRWKLPDGGLDTIEHPRRGRTLRFTAATTAQTHSRSSRPAGRQLFDGRAGVTPEASACRRESRWFRWPRSSSPAGAAVVAHLAITSAPDSIRSSDGDVTSSMRRGADTGRKIVRRQRAELRSYRRADQDHHPSFSLRTRASPARTCRRRRSPQQQNSRPAALRRRARNVEQHGKTSTPPRFHEPDMTPRRKRVAHIERRPV